MGRQWNTQNPSQQNPVSDHLGHPVLYGVLLSKLNNSETAKMNKMAENKYNLLFFERSIYPLILVNEAEQMALKVVGKKVGKIMNGAPNNGR